MSPEQIEYIRKNIQENFFELEYFDDEELGLELEYEIVQMGDEIHTEWGGRTELIIKVDDEFHSFSFLRDSWNGDHSTSYNKQVFPKEVTRIEYE